MFQVKSAQKVAAASPKSKSLERKASSSPAGENVIKIKIIRKVIGLDGREVVTEEKREEAMPVELIDPSKPRVIKRTIFIVVRPDGQEEVTEEEVDEHAEGGKPSIFSRLRKIIRKVIGPDGREHASEEDAHFPELYVSPSKRPEEWVRRVKLIRKVQRADGSEQTTEEEVEDQDDAMPLGAKKKVTKLVYVVVLPDGNEQVLETDLEETKPGKFRVIRRTVRTIVVKNGERVVADETLSEPSADEKPCALDEIVAGLSGALKVAKPEDRPDLRPHTAEFIQGERSFWDERPDPKIAVVAAATGAAPEEDKESRKQKDKKKHKEKERTPEAKTPEVKPAKEKKQHKQEKGPVEEVSLMFGFVLSVSKETCALREWFVLLPALALPQYAPPRTMII